MTAHKHLKQLVRARMEKTGETYTTARRHIIKDAPASTDADTRWHFPGNVPATTALRVLLAQAGVRDPHTGQPFSEAMTFVLAGGIGIGVFQFYYEKEDFASFFVSGRHSWQDDLVYLQKAAARLRLTAEVKEATGAKVADTQLRETLQRGPCVAWVDMALLPHRAMPAYYQGGGYHVVTVYRIDSDSVLIGDLGDEPVAVPLADFAAARARIKKQKHRLLSLSPAGKRPDVTNLVTDALEECRKELGKSSAKSMRGNFQLDVLKTWADRLHGDAGKDGWARVFKPGVNLWRGLTSIYDFIENYGTGGALCRSLFAEGLTEAAASLGDDRLAALAKRYTDLGRQWSELADTAMPEGVPVMRAAKKLRVQRGELLHSGAAPDKVRAAWEKIEEQQRAAGECFPLKEAQCDELRAELQAQVRAIYEAEVAAVA